MVISMIPSHATHQRTVIAADARMIAKPRARKMMTTIHGQKILIYKKRLTPTHMKYENFEKAQSIVGTIRNLESTLKGLDADVITIKIFDEAYAVQTIGTWSDSEHPYADLGRSFIADIKKDLQYRIDLKKHELSEL
jgi:hypothetical protein